MTIRSLAATQGEMIGELISKVVKAFADHNKLSCDLWHKDAPLWVVTDLDWSESNVGPVVHKVEVGVFHTDTSVEILAIPDAYQVVRGERVEIDPKYRLDLVEKLPFSEFQKDVDVGKAKLQGRLEKAWTAIKGWTPPP